MVLKTVTQTTQLHSGIKPPTPQRGVFMMGSGGGEASSKSEAAIVVHSLCKHTLPRPPVALAAPQRMVLDKLPENALHRVASKLDTARDLCGFEILSRGCRWVFLQLFFGIVMCYS